VGSSRGHGCPAARLDLPGRTLAEGAYAALITGAVLALGAIIVQNYWAAHFYPFLLQMGWVPGISHFLDGVTSYTKPWIVWHMDPVKFPINSVEVTFVAIVSGVLAYVIGSLVTYRKPYNLERMLHRDRGYVEVRRTLRSATSRLWL